MTNVAATMCADMARNAMQLAREGAVDALFAKRLVYRSYKSLHHLAGSLDQLTDQLSDVCSCCLRNVGDEFRVIVRQADTVPPRQLVFTEDIPWGALCKQCATRLTVNIKESRVRSADQEAAPVVYTGTYSEFLSKAFGYEARLYSMISNRGAELDQLLELGSKFRRSTDPAYYSRAIGILLDECKVCADVVEFVTGAFVQRHPNGQQTATICDVAQSAAFELSRAEAKAAELLSSHGDHSKLYQSAVLLHGLCDSILKVAERIDIDLYQDRVATQIYLSLPAQSDTATGNLEDVYYHTLREWNEDILFLDKKLEDLMYINSDSREYAAAALSLIQHLYKMCTGRETPNGARSRIGLLREMYIQPGVLGTYGTVFRDVLCSMFETNTAYRKQAKEIAKTVGLWSAEFVAAVDDFIGRAQKSGYGMTVPDFVHSWEHLLIGHENT